MNNTLIFLRHASTKKDATLPIEHWVVKEESMPDIVRLADSGVFDNVDQIYASTERKAVQTAEPFAKRLNKSVTQVAELGEIKRPGSEKLSTEEYKKIKLQIFENMDFTTEGWETANQALERFSQAIGKIDSQNENKEILIVSHGTVMTLYFAKLQGQLGNIFARWKDLEFGSWGLVRNGVVQKDIV